MAVRKTQTLLGVFYLAFGSVCAGPALQATAQSAANPADENDPIHLFDEPEGVDAPLPRGQSVDVGTFGEIDLHVKDLDLTKVLQLLSIQSQRNIIASRNVAGSVSADLYGVDFYDALDAILTTNGFGYREKGNFIYVYTQDEIAAMEEAERQVVTRIRRLSYLTASDAATFAQPLLSQAGSIAVSGDAGAGIIPSSGDAGANSFASDAVLVIRDYPENVQQIESLLGELDVRPRQVLVEATILQAELTEANAWGVDFSVVADVDLDMFANPLNVVDKLISGSVEGANSATAVQSTVGNTAAGPSGIKVGVVGSDAAVFIRALDNVTDTTVIANPKLLVLNRQRADLLVGGRIGYLSTTSTETSTTETVEFLEVGTQLSLRPFVSQDDFIRLELRPSLSTGEVRQLGSSVIPETAEQTLTTNVIVRNGQTVVLGGLFKEETTVNRNQVPGAGDIPILGAALKGQDDSVNRSEVIFLIKPTIIRDQILAEVSEDVQESMRLAQIGAKKSLLPWSRSKMTNANLKAAYGALEAGKVEKAKWFVDLALNNEPGNIDALRLKEELTGKTMHNYDPSILEEATRQMIDRELERTGKAPATAPTPAGQPAATPASEPVDVIELPLPAPAPSKAAAPAPAPATEPADDESMCETASAPEPTRVEITPATITSGSDITPLPEAPAPKPQAQTTITTEPEPAPAPQATAPITPAPQPQAEMNWDNDAFEFDLMGARKQPAPQAQRPATADDDASLDEDAADAWLRQLNAEAQDEPAQPQAKSSTGKSLFSTVEKILPGDKPTETVTEAPTDVE